MAKLKISPLLQIIFHLFVTSLAMTLAISYCTSLAPLLIMEGENVGLGIGLLVGIYFVPSLFFYMLAWKWIVQNSSAILCIYCTTSLLFTLGKLIKFFFLPNFPFKSFTEFVIVLFANFMMWLIQLLPLISLVATPTFVISSIFAYFKKGGGESSYLKEN